MARVTSDIVYNVTGQTLAHRSMTGRPSAVTFAVYDSTTDDDDSVVEFSGTGTVDTVSTTVDAASGPSQADPNKISLAATTGIRTDRRYKVSENALSEYVSPIEVVDGDYIRVRHPLANDYTTAAVFESTYVTAAVDDTWVADDANITDHGDPDPGYRVKWTITIDSVDRVEYSYFDLVRGAVDTSVTIEDINLRLPGLVNSLPDEYVADKGQAMIESAHRVVQQRLHSIGLNDAAIRDNSAVDELVILAAIRMLAAGGVVPPGFDPAEYFAIAQAEEDRFFERHFQVTRKRATAEGTSSDAERRHPVPLWIR